MAKLLKLRRGTSSQHGNFTGAEGEVTVDVTKDTLVVHDGSTQGGFPVLRAEGGDQNINTTGNITTTGIGSVGELQVTSTAPKIVFTDSDSNPDYEVRDLNGVFHVKDVTNNAVRLQVNADGTVDVEEKLNCNGGLDTDGDVKFNSGTTNMNITFDASEQSLEFDDNVKATFGFDKDLEIYHSGSASVINDAGTGSLKLQTGGNTRFKIDTNGVTVTGDVAVSGTVDGRDVAADGQKLDGYTTSTIGELKDGVTGTTQAQSDNSTKVATTAYVRSAVSGVVDSAPAALDTLNELAAALGDDANFATTTANSIGSKLPLAGGQMTGNITFSGSQTVDGRDLSADGSKLDGIASGATNNGSGSLSSYLPLSGGLMTGGLTGTKATFLDNGASSPTVQIATDDGSPWALAIRNDTYWNNDSNGLKMYQDNSGNVDVRTTGNNEWVNWYLNTQNGGTTNTLIHFDTSRAVHLKYQGSEKLATTSGGAYVTGDMTASGNVTAYSDARLKTDISTINDALGIVGKLRGVSYKWLRDGAEGIGVIAQEVEEVIPSVVVTTEVESEDGPLEVKSVDYGKIVGVLINAINELKAEIDELKGGK